MEDFFVFLGKIVAGIVCCVFAVLLLLLGAWSIVTVWKSLMGAL